MGFLSVYEHTSTEKRTYGVALRKIICQKVGKTREKSLKLQLTLWTHVGHERRTFQTRLVRARLENEEMKNPGKSEYKKETLHINGSQTDKSERDRNRDSATKKEMGTHQYPVP